LYRNQFADYPYRVEVGKRGQRRNLHGTALRIAGFDGYTYPPHDHFIHFRDEAHAMEFKLVWLVTLAKDKIDSGPQSTGYQTSVT
jgi:hypothetical protein